MSQDKTPVQSPESDVSPKSQPTPKADYFSAETRQASPGPVEDNGANVNAEKGGLLNAAQVEDVRTTLNDENATEGNETEDVKGKQKEEETTGAASATTAGETASSNGSSGPSSRKASISSVTFRAPRTSLPQGSKRPHRAGRIRDSSPPHPRFESHVAFDNIPLGESTTQNPISLTLNVRHAGFQFKRRHRTFMVGVDDNAYSDHALQWLLDELVDDGDEIVCVRVIENPIRVGEKAYQEDAQSLMDSIQAKNTQNRAIGLVLEYAVGKLHNTFQHLIKIYQPSMLIVGTKGRSLDGMQGFLVSRSSFSKYCLQYSPVPVVVVRPTEKREKKKAKRAGDPTRQSYIHMLAGQKHEADGDHGSLYELEPKITADEEAHRVAVAVGLPAAYDPTIKPIDPNSLLKKSGRISASKEAPIEVLAAAALKGRVPTDKAVQGEDSDSDSDAEFEVTTGQDVLKRERLHRMESNEGAALRSEARKLSIDSDEDGPGGGGAKT